MPSALTNSRINTIASATGLDPATAASLFYQALLGAPTTKVDVTVQAVIATYLNSQAANAAQADFANTVADLASVLGSPQAPPPAPGPVPSTPAPTTPPPGPQPSVGP